MKRAAFVVFCALWSALTVQAEWTITSSQSDSPADRMVVHRRTTVQDGESDRATVDFALFNARSASLRVLDQPGPARRALAEVLAAEHALAGSNGGYFDLDLAPLGLLIRDGKTISPLRRARLLTGVLFAGAGEVDIVRAARFAMRRSITNAVQCGPLLIERAKEVTGLNASRAARRTFAAVDGKGRAALGVCSAVSLAQLAKILGLTNVAGDLKIVRALNLDGGSSSAFWFGGKGEPLSISEEKTVRDFVAIMPRPVR